MDRQLTKSEQRKAERLVEHKVILKTLSLIKDEALLTMSPRRFEALARKVQKCL